VRCGAGFHGHDARGKRRHERQKTRARQALSNDGSSLCIRGMDLKNVLGQIDPDYGNLFHGHPSYVAILTSPPWHIAMPSGGGVHTIRTGSGFVRLLTRTGYTHSHLS
jgi:hypothetical protein